MNVIGLVPLIAALINLLLSFVVLAAGRQSKTSRVYLVWGLSLFVWNIGTFLMFRVSEPSQALVIGRLLQFGVILLPVTLLHLAALNIESAKAQKLVVMLYGIAGLFVTSNLVGLFITHVRFIPVLGAYYTQGGFVYKLFIAFYSLLTIATLTLLLRGPSGMSQMHRTRLRLLLTGVCLLFLGGTNDILPIIGVYKYPYLNVPVLPFGSAMAVFYGVLIAYTVLQHQFLDVRIVLSKFAALTVRFGFLLLVALACLLTLVLVRPDSFTGYSFFSALVSIVLSGAIASIYFPRLFGGGSGQLEQRILGDNFEYHDRMRSFVGSIQNYTDSSMLLTDLHSLLAETVRVRIYHIILQDEASHTFTPFLSHPRDHPGASEKLQPDAAVFGYFTQTGAKYLICSEEYVKSLADESAVRALAELNNYQPEICLPLFSEDGIFGLLALGQKANGEPYTATDVSLFLSLVRNLSLVMNQVRLKQQVQQAQEIELLGRMSRGMAHDLNNLLTPIWTLLQLSQEGVPPHEAGDLVEVALRNIKVMRSYIHESLFFAEHLRPNFKLGRLDALISQAAEIIGTRKRRHRVDVLFNSPGEVLVEMDEVLIQRLVLNIISNAIDASPQGASVRIEIERLGRRSGDVDWLRMRVVDSGKGIRPEDLERIYRPFFTTKDRGDETRGFGLGLAICRKIVELHHGTLHIASKPNEGTTVIADLPMRQVEPFTAARTNHQ